MPFELTDGELCSRDEHREGGKRGDQVTYADEGPDSMGNYLRPHAILDEHGRPEVDGEDNHTETDEETLYGEIPSTEGDMEEQKKVKMAVSDKVYLVLGGIGMAASIWKIFPSPEGSPVKPYDGIIFFGGIALVAVAGGLSLYSNRSAKTPPSTYEDETW